MNVKPILWTLFIVTTLGGLAGVLIWRHRTLTSGRGGGVALKAPDRGSESAATSPPPGRFGDPNGVPATESPNKTANIAKQGSYDLPPGPGYGNGTGGARGAKGVEASAEFGNGAQGGSGGSQGTVVASAGQRPTNEAPKPRNGAAAAPRTEPVEILFKPKPLYTDLARQKRIEGEVLVEVVFTSTNEVRVLRVVRGLGYGLDEAAVAAARQIRFRPARQDGHPVDSTATVHVLFELDD